MPTPLDRSVQALSLCAKTGQACRHVLHTSQHLAGPFMATPLCLHPVSMVKQTRHPFEFEKRYSNIQQSLVGVHLPDIV